MEALIAGLKVCETKRPLKTLCSEYTQSLNQFQSSLEKASKLELEVCKLPNAVIANQDLVDSSLEQVYKLHCECLAEIQNQELEFQQKLYKLNTERVQDLAEAKLKAHKLALEVNNLQTEVNRFEKTGSSDLHKLSALETVANLFGSMYCDAEFGNELFRINDIEFEEYDAADSSLVFQNEPAVIKIRSVQTQLTTLNLNEPQTMAAIISQANKPILIKTQSVFDKYPSMKKILVENTLFRRSN